MLQVLFAFFGSMALTHLLRQPAFDAGLVDRPSGRKSHHGVIPVVGGLAMVLTFIASAAAVGADYRYLPQLLAITLIVLLTGVLDDRHELSPRTRLVAQVVAAMLMATWGDHLIVNLGDIAGTGRLALAGWALPFTVFAAVGVINAMNMIDGLDGLAGGIAMIAMTWLAAAAAVCCAESVMYLLLVWIASVAGFLLFNLRYPMRQRAKVFMGDAGSTVLGLSLAWFAVELTQRGGKLPSLYPISAVWILGVPIMDTVYLMCSRLLRGQSAFAPDRRHIHHTLPVMGLTEGWALGVTLALSFAFGAVGFAGWYFEVPEYVLGYGFLAGFAVYCFVMQYWQELFRLPSRTADLTWIAAGTKELCQKKVVFVNRFFYPDESATSQLLSDLAFFLAGKGIDVHVVTSRLHYVDRSHRHPARETVRRVHIHRVWSSGLGHQSLPGRAIDYLTFYLGAGIALIHLLTRGDVVIAKTDPPLVSVVAAAVARLRRATLVTWLQDLFPEVARAAGIRAFHGPLWHVAKAARDWSLRVASANVAVGEAMRSHVDELGLSARRLTVIHNWADGDAIRPQNPESRPVRRESGLEGRFVVEYSGNLGRVHDHKTLLEVMSELHGDARVVFLFVGQGHGLHQLREEATRRGLSNVVFKPLQPRDRLAQSLALGDVHLVTLAAGMGRFVVPSKLYGVLAAGRPIVFVGDLQSEIPVMLDVHECGFSVQTGDVQGLAQTIRSLAEDSNLRSRLGANARLVFEQRFTKHIALEAWRRVIEVTGAPGGDRL